MREAEDLAPKFGYSPGMEARFARVALDLQNSGISLSRLAPGFRQPFGHKHERQEEVYVLASDNARAKIGDDIVELKAWDAVRVSPETMRAFEAGPEGAEIVIFGAPSTENDDASGSMNWWTD